MHRILYLALFAVLLLPSAALAKPSADEVKDVLDHYSSGTEVILYDSVFCSAITKNSENKNECVDDLDPRALNQHDKAFLWMSFMVPKDTSPKLLVKFIRLGKTMKTRDISLKDSFRFRTGVQIPTNKIGDWKIIIDQEGDNGSSTISTLTYRVRR